MYKLLIPLVIAGSLGFAQTQADPEAASKKTAQQKGYHITSPKNTGPTPSDAKKDQEKDKAENDKKAREKDGLQDQTPPTYQPSVKPPGKP